MNTYIDRLYQERSELRQKIYDLEAFTVSDKIAEASVIQVSLINIQHSAMTAYLRCIEERIHWIEIQNSRSPETV